MTYLLPKGVHKILKCIEKKCQKTAMTIKLLKHKESEMCQFCFINVLKLKTMINKNLQYVSPLLFSYILLALGELPILVLNVLNVFIQAMRSKIIFLI